MNNITEIKSETSMTTEFNPENALAQATVAAKALKGVISQKTKPVIMNGEQYLEFEDWQTLGYFYGYTAKVTNTKPIYRDEMVVGYEARAEVVKNGQVISAAEAMCSHDEPKWNTRKKYEWKTRNGKRVKEAVGEEPVPDFQLRSMVQTRACAKALRNVLAWVVVLAGYKPTPAEEIMDMVEAKPHTKSDEPTEIVKEPLQETPNELVCSDCGEKITAAVKTYSVKNFGTALCFDCQKKQ